MHCITIPAGNENCNKLKSSEWAAESNRVNRIDLAPKVELLPFGKCCEDITEFLTQKAK